MKRLLLAAPLLMAANGAVHAQSYPGYGYPSWPGDGYGRPYRYEDRYSEPPRPYLRSWRDDAYYDRRLVRPPSRDWADADDETPRPRPTYRDRRANEDDDAAPVRPRGQKVMDGGSRPDIAPIRAPTIPFASKYEPGTVIIETKGRQLLLVTSSRSAMRYPISVGREGFTWSGTEKISRIAEWPDWHPPEDMRRRDPNLPEKMTGGLRNPLGAKALYLGNTLYRIHGTNDAKTIGLAASSGCFRMLNGHVIDLASRVSVGTTVVVVDRLPRHAFPMETAREAPAPRYYGPRY